MTKGADCGWLTELVRNKWISFG